MDRDTPFRLAGCALLGLWIGALLVGIGRGNDQKRVVGFDPERSLAAACAPGGVAFFTNRERLAVYLQKADGRVAAQPVYRGGEIGAIACDAGRGELVVSTGRGERRVAIAAARAAPQLLARAASTSQSTKAMTQGLSTDSGATTAW